MQRTTLVRGARQLLTLRGPSGPRRGADLRNLGIIQDGAVLIADGRIAEVGPSRRLENLAAARGAKEIDASGCVVMPGFVDSHLQVVRGGAHELSPRTLKTLAFRVLEEAVRNGTTALEAKSGGSLTEAGELKILRVHSSLRELPITVVSTFLAAGAAPGFCDRLLPVVRRRQLAEFAEMGDDGEALRLLAFARELGLGIKISTGAIALAIESGATSVDDVREVTERDAMLLSQSPTIATLSPGVAFHGDDPRHPPARTLIDRGAAIALASGLHQPNMQIPVAVACRSMGLTAAEAISASTINGAHAMRRGDMVGSLEAGKSADLVVMGVPDYRELPYHLGVNLMNLVMIRGAVVVEKSQVAWPVG